MTAYRCHDCGSKFFVRNDQLHLKKRCSPCTRRERARREARPAIPEPARLELVALLALVKAAVPLVTRVKLFAPHDARLTAETWLEKVDDALPACVIAAKCEEAGQ